jgi:hypothetical protein
MLHHPLRNIDNVKAIHGRMYITFEEAYVACRDGCEHPLSDAYEDNAHGVEEDNPNLAPLQQEEES